MKIEMTLDHLPCAIAAPVLLNIYRQTYTHEMKNVAFFIQNLTYEEMQMHPYWIGVSRVLSAKNTLGFVLNTYQDILEPKDLAGFVVQPFKRLNPKFWIDTFVKTRDGIYDWANDTPNLPDAYRNMVCDVVECLEYIVRFLECASSPSFAVNLNTFEVKNLKL